MRHLSTCLASNCVTQIPTLSPCRERREMKEGKGGERREKKEERGRREGKEGEMAREKERKENGSKRHCAMDTVYSDIFCNTKCYTIYTCDAFCTGWRNICMDLTFFTTFRNGISMLCRNFIKQSHDKSN